MEGTECCVPSTNLSTTNVDVDICCNIVVKNSFIEAWWETARQTGLAGEVFIFNDSDDAYACIRFDRTRLTCYCHWHAAHAALRAVEQLRVKSAFVASVQI